MTGPMAAATSRQEPYTIGRRSSSQNHMVILQLDHTIGKLQQYAGNQLIDGIFGVFGNLLGFGHGTLVFRTGIFHLFEISA